MSTDELREMNYKLDEVIELLRAMVSPEDAERIRRNASRRRQVNEGLRYVSKTHWRIREGWKGGPSEEGIEGLQEPGVARE